MDHQRASAGLVPREKNPIVRDDCTISSQESVFFQRKKVNILATPKTKEQATHRL